MTVYDGVQPTANITWSSLGGRDHRELSTMHCVVTTHEPGIHESRPNRRWRSFSRQYRLLVFMVVLHERF